MRTNAKPNYTLEKHNTDLLRALDSLTDTIPHMLDSIGIPTNLSSMFIDFIRITCILHDIGKANSWFVETIDRHKIIQRYRHEHISALVIEAYLKDHIISSLDIKYKGFGTIGYLSIIYAIVHHHQKLNVGSDKEFQFCADIPGYEHLDNALFFGNSIDVEWILHQIGYNGHIGCINVVDLVNTHRDDMEDMYLSPGCDGIDWIKAAESEMTIREGGLIIFFKMILQFIDSIGSCDGRVNDIDVVQYVKAGLTTSAKPAVDDILSRKYRNIIEETGKFEFNGAQEYIRKHENYRLACVKDTGGGKSIMQYQFYNTFKDPSQYLVILLPTTGTSDSAFGDYGIHSDESTLLHSSNNNSLRAIDLKMKSNGDEFTISDHELDPRLYSLACYGKKVIYATIDQFVSVMTNKYSGIIMLPLIMHATVVFDEIHAPDRRLFDACIAMMKCYKFRCLVLSASLDAVRREMLADAGFKFLDPSSELSPEFKDDREQSSIKRYAIQYNGNIDSIIDDIISDYMQGKQVICIFNRSESAARFYVMLCRRINISDTDKHSDILCYHGKFEEGRKVELNSEVITKMREYRRKKQGLIVVSSQVCEMALDIKAKIYSEIAPLWSEIQRFGRSEVRGSISVDSEPSEIIIFDAINSRIMTSDADHYWLPYLKEDIMESMSLLGIYDKRSNTWNRDRILVSQKDLSDSMRKLIPHGDFVDMSEINLMADPIANRKGSLRVESSISGIREENLDKYRMLIDANDQIGASRMKLSIPLNEYGNLKKGFSIRKEDVNGRRTNLICIKKPWVYNDVCGLFRAF